MNSPDSTPIGNVSTYTFRNADGKATEVLLIPLDCTELGRDNAYPPPELAADGFSNWVRSGYFFMNGDAIAQLPRNASDLPLDQSASQVTDVVARDDVLEVYYPVNREKVVRLVWTYREDEWRAEYADCRVKDGSVHPDDFEDDATVVWSINPEKYTD
jgi:hypothetical protein